MLKLNSLFFLLLIILVIIQSNLFAEKLELTVRFIGIKVAKVSMIDQENTLEIKAVSTSIASLATKMNNLYISQYENDYLTISYKKKIQQRDYHEDRITDFDHKNRTATRKSNLNPKLNKYYNIEPGTRDFFSALYFLRFNFKSNSGYLYIDANTLNWKCNYRLVKTEKIKTYLGKKDCLKIAITFSKFSNREPERSDLLTNNLVNEDIELLFWFTNDDLRLPVKAKFMMKPFPVVWVLENFKD